MVDRSESLRWTKIRDRVSLEKNALDASSKSLLNLFYLKQDEIFRADLNDGFFGAWVGFSKSNATDQSSAFDAVIKQNGGEVSELGKFDSRRVKLVRFARSNGVISTQLWVDPKHGRYNKAYKFYAKKEFNFVIKPSYGWFLNIDHIFNHARAEREALSFVRLTLVDADVNQMWGGEYESLATATSKGAITGVRFATDLMLAKIFRLCPPPINDRFEVEEHAMNDFVDKLNAVGVIGPKEVLSANVCLALNKAKSGLNYRRICAADRELGIFYFNLDLPMDKNDKGPNFVEFELRASGCDLHQLTNIQVLDAKNAIKAWVNRQFG